MKAEKLIKEKLNELNEIPDGFHFDQADTWKRLQMRMDTDSSKRGVVQWFQRLTRAVSAFFAGAGIQQPNRRRDRRRLNERRGYRH